MKKKNALWLLLLVASVVETPVWANESGTPMAQSLDVMLPMTSEEHAGHKMAEPDAAAPTQPAHSFEAPASQPMPPKEHSGDMPNDMSGDMPDDMQMPSTAPAQAHPEGGHPLMHHAGAMPMDTVKMETETGETTSNWQQSLIMTNMRRDGSGTSWIPMDNPMLMKMGQWKNWTGMLHWSAFADYDQQTGPRGDNGFYSQNWAMASAMTPVKRRGLFQARAMMSLEPLTVGTHGYPLLFQTGETYRGQPLIDRQHPHDLFMELSTQYYHRLNDDTLLRVYLAPVGEPALGPVAFPHRYSAYLNPDSPLGHHMQDSTHIAFGVATAGLIYKNKWQLEGSVFNGSEPNENRYNFDYERWRTAYSGRLSYMPNEHWALQTSYGYLNEPERQEPGNIHRLTASAQYGRTWRSGWTAASLSWGHNFKTFGANEDDILLEGVVNFLSKNYVFTRIEQTFKHDLFGPEDESASLNEHDSFFITAFSLGVARDLFHIKGIPITLGGMVTLFAKPGRLNEAYGNFPMGFHVFLHTNAPPMQMSHQGH